VADTGNDQIRLLRREDNSGGSIGHRGTVVKSERGRDPFAGKVGFFRYGFLELSIRVT
jgi:hypothetical protein